MAGNLVKPQTPIWSGASAGSPLYAGQSSQFMGGHSATILWESQQVGASAGPQANTNYQTLTSTYVAQPFTTQPGQTTLSYVDLYVLCSNPGSPSFSAPVTLSLCADSGTYSPIYLAPNSSGQLVSQALVSTTITREYTFNAAYPLRIPLPVTGLVPGVQYWMVFSQGDTTGVNYRWVKATSTSGGVCVLSTNGTTWTSQSFGLSYILYSQTPSPVQNIGSNVIGTWEDGGARWTIMYRKTTGTFEVNNFVTSMYEYTAGQAGNMSYVQSVRNNVNTGSGQLTILN